MIILFGDSFYFYFLMDPVLVGIKNKTKWSAGGGGGGGGGGASTRNNRNTNIGCSSLTVIASVECVGHANRSSDAIC